MEKRTSPFSELKIPNLYRLIIDGWKNRKILREVASQYTLIIDKIIKYSTVSTKYPQIYKSIECKHKEFDPSKKTIIVVTGPSGVGKGSVSGTLIETGIPKITTGTTRARRLIANGDLYDEAENAYVWLELSDEHKNSIEIAKKENRQLTTEENTSIKEYLIKKYDLLEISGHMGNYYGLPRSSINNVNSNLLILETDPNGVNNYYEKTTLTSEYNIVTICILPDQDNLSPLLAAVKTRVNWQKRALEGPEGISKIQDKVNYWIVNQANTNPEEGAKFTANQLLALLKELNLL